MKNKTFYNDAPKYCEYFFDLIPTDNLLLELNNSKQLTLEVFRSVTTKMENYTYQPNKWTTKEVLQHIIDMERIFAYRAFRLSRLDATELSGVEENDYIDAIKQLDINLTDLQEEYIAVRNATYSIFKNCTAKMLDFKGTANHQTYTARTLGFAIIGHNIHHCNVIKTKYMVLPN